MHGIIIIIIIVTGDSVQLALITSVCPSSFETDRFVSGCFYWFFMFCFVLFFSFLFFSFTLLVLEAKRRWITIKEQTTKGCRRKHWLHVILNCHVTLAHGTDLSFDGRPSADTGEKAGLGNATRCR